MGDRLFDKRIDNYFRTENIIIDREDLDIYEKMIYIVLCRYANNNDGAFPSYSTIARNASVCRDKAIKTVKSLLDKNLIEKETRIDRKKGNQTNLYYVLTAKPNTDDLVVNNYHPSSQQLPNKQQGKKNNSFKKNNNKKEKSKKDVVVSLDVEIITERFQELYGAGLNKKRTQELINVKGLEKVKNYIDNYSHYIQGREIKNLGADFYSCVMDEYSMPKGASHITTRSTGGLISAL